MHTTQNTGTDGAARSDERFRDRTIGYRLADLLLALHRRRGPVISVGAGSNRYVYLLGAEANKFVFANSHLFRWKEAFEGLVPVDGPTSLIVSDGDEHQRRRRLVQPALHYRQIDGYVRIMAENADAAINSWRPGQTVDLYQAFRAAILRSTIESLFGKRLAADADFFGEQLQSLLDLVGLPQVATWKRRLHTPGWRRAMIARRRVDERIFAEIERTRRTGADTDDHVLAVLVHGRDQDGDGLSDAEVRDQVVTLIAAGYETTSGAMAWAIYALLSTSGVWERARAEVRTVLGDSPPTTADLKRMTYLNGVVQESLRLYPPAVVSARKVIQDFDYAGKRIPSGSLLIYSPYITHRLPELWPEPLAFRPQRWDPDAPDYRKRAPYEYLPFSAGPHRCIGSALATTEIAVMLCRLLARTSPWLPEQRITASSFSSLRPRHGLLAKIDLD